MLNRGMFVMRSRRLQWLLGVGALAIFVMAGAGSALAEVTGAADNLRTGWYPDEPSLTPSLLGGGSFLQAFKDSLKGQIYAQPLTADGVLLVATEDNWVYGLDPNTGAQLWAKNVGTPVNTLEAPIACADLQPHLGITGTPVIDTEHNVAYFVSNRYIKNESGSIAWYMHAVELGSGKEVANFPVEIKGKAQNIPGVEFEAPQELQRPALLMTNGVVYAGFGSHCDHSPYEGWLVGVSTTGQLTTKWATSGNGGSIWQSGGGLVSDGPGQILFSTGNDNGVPGEWDPSVGPGGVLGSEQSEGKFGESVVRAEVQPTGDLKAKDFFSPFNNKELDVGDIDLGSSAPIALPSQYFGTPSVPDLLVQDGKEGYVYLLNRDELGGMGQGLEGKDQVVQKLGPYGGVWGSAAAWPGDGGYVYIPTVGGTTSSLLSFRYGVGKASGEPTLSFAAESPEEFAFGSGSPIVTSSGATSGTGVVWITRCPENNCKNAELVAYDPVPLGKALQRLWHAPIGAANKFSRPDASDGHIYVGNHDGDIFGYSGPALTPSSASLELGSTSVGAQLIGEVTFTNTGTPLTVSAVHSPASPFNVTDLPTVGTKIRTGEVIKIHVTFNSSSPGVFNESLGLKTEAGETNVALSGSATAPSPSPSTPPESGGIATTASLVTAPGDPGSLTATTAPLVSLAHLQIRAAASRPGSHRRRVVVTYTLSAAGTVDLTIYRRVIGHSCQGGASACVRWVRTKIKLEVAGHMGKNVLTVNLAQLPAGYYRLAATPLAVSGVPETTQYVHFKTVR